MSSHVPEFEHNSEWIPTMAGCLHYTTSETTSKFPLILWLQKHKLTVTMVFLSHCCYKKRLKNYVNVAIYSQRCLAFKVFQNIAPPYLSYLSLLILLPGKFLASFFIIEHFHIPQSHVFIFSFTLNINLYPYFLPGWPYPNLSALPQGWPIVDPNV